MNKALSELRLNKNLIVDKESKLKIITAENGRYSYFDYTREKIEEIASKDIKEIKIRDVNPLVQALFPNNLICSGLFHPFIIFEIKDKKRVDPPTYYYGSMNSYLNCNDELKFNRLIDEIVDLFTKNEIKCHQSWLDYYVKVIEGEEDEKQDN